jgi:hypothetical protein
MECVNASPSSNGVRHVQLVNMDNILINSHKCAKTVLAVASVARDQNSISALLVNLVSRLFKRKPSWTLGQIH